jgi:hypothetical protein
MDTEHFYQIVTRPEAGNGKKSYNINRADHYAAEKKKMEQWLEKAEQVLGKSIPKDFLICFRG